MSPDYPFNIRSKGQRQRSQGNKVQKLIEGDRVAGVSLHSIECPTSSSHLHRESKKGVASILDSTSAAKEANT